MGRFACILAVSLMFAACAKKENAAPTECETYASNFAVQWPDGSIQKSEVTQCSDGTFSISDMAGSTFQTSDPLFQVTGSNGSPQLVHFEYYY